MSNSQSNELRELDLPDKIKSDHEYNNGYSERKSDRELVVELVEGFNQLIEYLTTKQNGDK